MDPGRGCPVVRHAGAAPASARVVRRQRGEAVGLRWADVDLDAGQARIAQQVVQLGWATEVGEPKTDSGSRTLSLDRRTIEVLRGWRAQQQAERDAWGPAWHQTGHMFTRTAPRCTPTR